VACLYRTIPVEYVTPQGLNYTLFLDVKRVTDASGRTLKYESSGKPLSQAQDLRPGRRQFHEDSFDRILSFRCAEIFETTTNSTGRDGDEWDIPIQSASTRIIFRSTTNIRANIFTGAYRSRAQNADIEIAGNGVEVRTREPLHLHKD